MKIPADLKYTKEHEWIRIEADNIAFVGITDYAQGELGDIVYVDIETEGEEVEKDAVFGSVEAVKTVSDLYLPVSAKILEVNEELASDPELVNKEPYEKGWMVKIELTNPEELESLMTHEDYEKLISE